MFEPIRGGTRGGQAEFKWTDVSADKDRENYLGHSINAPTGRWQKNKDVHWYSREKQQAEDERVAEITRIKELEAEALAVALGFEPAKKPVPGTMTTTSQASPTSITRPPTDGSPTPNAAGAQRTNEKEERQRRKAQRKEEKRARKEETKRLRIRESRHPRYAIDEGRGRGMRSRSRSRSRSRTPLPSRSRPNTIRRSASPRHRAFPSRRRPLSRSLSRSPPPRRPDSYRDTLASTHEPPARRRRRSFSRSSLGSSRSRTPPPTREDESQERRNLPTDGADYRRSRQSPLRRDSDVRGQRDKGYYDRRR